MSHIFYESAASLKELCYIILLLCAQLNVRAQQSLRFHRLSVNDGLSQNTVIALVQDHNGFMWLATQDGLNRYDGYSFKVYRHADDNPASLSNNYVMSLAVDKRGNLWAGTTNGLNRIDGRTGKLSRIDLSHLVVNASNYRIHSIVGGENGCVYFGMSWGLFCIDTVGKVSRINAIGDSLQCLELKLQKNRLWIGTGKQVICYDYLSDKILSGPLSVKDGLMLLRVSDEAILYEASNRLFKYDLKSGITAEVYSKYFNTSGTGRKIVSAFFDSKDEWICTETGLIWQHGTDTLLIKHIEAYGFSLSSDYVYCVYKDSAGLYWIGTSRGGLCIFDPLWQNFKTISEPLGLHVAVWSIAEKGDTLILATAKGIKAYRKKNGVSRISSCFLPEQALAEIRLPGLQEQLKDLLISSVCIDGSANLWIGTENNGVYHYDFSRKHLKNFVNSEQDSASLINNSVLHLDTLSARIIGVSTPFGFSEIDISNFKFRSIRLTKMQRGPTNNYILKSWLDGERLWFSSACGLCMLNRKTGKFQQFLPDRKNVEEQYHNIVSDIKKDARNRYWVSTLGYGLLKFDAGTGNFKRFGLSEGLRNETILGILPDGRYLWLGTNEGIAKFDTENGVFENFDARDGLESKECTKNGFYKSPSGDLFFGTMSGLLVFDPALVHTDTALLKTVLTGIKINYATVENNSEYISGSNFSPEALNLDHTVKTISFEFAALYFLNPENIEYKYKLQGFSDTWVKVSSANRNAIYTNLPPNTYTFMVIPVLHGKDVTSGKLVFIIHVKPPFWLTWWFILSAGVCAVLLISFIVRYLSQRKLKNKLRQVEEEQKLQKEKERISRELHDNVGSQLTYIIKSLDTLSYKSAHGDTQMILHLDALSNFSRETLNQLRESIWAINSKVIPLSELISRTHEYVNKINGSFEGTRIKLDAVFREDTPLSPTIAINSFRILQEAITNSLKYAEADQVLITIRQNANLELEFVICDNGKGFDPGNQKKKGYGLENMQARASELDATFRLSSGPGKGTEISFLIRMQ